MIPRPLPPGIDRQLLRDRRHYRNTGFDGRQVYRWLTRGNWISFWFVHGPDRYNIFTYAMQDMTKQ